MPWAPGSSAPYQEPGKSRLAAAALALLLGGIGVHRFYLGQTAAGILYLVFFWTGIPALIGWIEGIAYLLKSDVAWAAEYGGPVRRSSPAGLGCLWLVALIPLLLVASSVLLISLGAQVSSILSTTGQTFQTAAPVRPSPAAVGDGRTPAATVSPSAGEATEEPLPSWFTELPHQAPEVEALVPATINGLPLAIWSVRGESWLELAGLSRAEVVDMRQAVEEAGGSLDDCAQVIAGRAAVGEDPPYFVYVYRIPDSAFDTVGPVVLGTVGWLADLEPDSFETATLGGKTVYVGTNDMLGQSEHQRGRPYWYELDADTLVIVVTDEEAWAIDALQQLP